MYNPTYNRVVQCTCHFTPKKTHGKKGGVFLSTLLLSTAWFFFETHRGDVYTKARSNITSAKKLHNSRPGDHGDLWGFYSFKAPRWDPQEIAGVIKGS